MDRVADNLIDVTWVAWAAERLREQWPRLDGATLEETARYLDWYPSGGTLPGHGFSGKPTALGSDPIHIARESILGCRACNRPGQDLRIIRNEVSRESDKWTCVTGGWSLPLPVVSQILGASSRDFSDTDRIRKTKGLAGNHRLTPVILGSPTWARTRDLRINSCEVAGFARLLETSWDC